MASPALMRNRDSDALRAILRRLRANIEVPVLFGGMVTEDNPVLTELFGMRTSSLRGLVIRPNAGLGGRAAVDGVPRIVDDYGTSPSITHDYDAQVLAEGITALVAI